MSDDLKTWKDAVLTCAEQGAELAHVGRDRTLRASDIMTLSTHFKILFTTIISYATFRHKSMSINGDIQKLLVR